VVLLLLSRPLTHTVTPITSVIATPLAAAMSAWVTVKEPHNFQSPASSSGASTLRFASTRVGLGVGVVVGDSEGTGVGCVAITSVGVQVGLIVGAREGV